MKTISTEQLHARLQSAPLAVFDVRGDVEYEKGHIPGAKTAPLGSLVFRVAHIMNPDSQVVVYSGGGDCTLAEQAAQRLQNLGMKSVYVYEGGLKSWDEAGLPITPSVGAKLITQGPVEDVRPIVVDRERAYGGAFKSVPADVSGAGG